MVSGIRRDRRILTGVIFVVMVAQVIIYPSVPELIALFDAPRTIDAGMWFLIAEYVAFIGFAAVWGSISDTVGHRRLLVMIGAFGGGVAYLSLGVLPSFGVGFGGAIAARFIGGLFIVGAFSLGITMLMDLVGGNGRNMGAAGFAIGGGAAVGSVVGGQLGDIEPLAPVFASGALLIVSGVLVLLIDDHLQAQTNPLALGPVVTQLRIRPSLFVPFGFGFVDRLTAGFFSLVGVFYFRETFDLSAGGAGMTLALFFLPFALLQYPFGSLSDRRGRLVPIVGGSVAYGVVIISIGLVNSYPLAAGLMFVIGICGALVSPTTMALVSDLADDTDHGTAMGGFNIFGSLGFLCGFLIGGTVTELIGYRSAFLLVGSFEIAIAVVLLPAVYRLTRGQTTARRMSHSD